MDMILVFPTLKLGTPFGVDDTFDVLYVRTDSSTHAQAMNSDNRLNCGSVPVPSATRPHCARALRNMYFIFRHISNAYLSYGMLHSSYTQPCTYIVFTERVWSLTYLLVDERIDLLQRPAVHVLRKRLELARQQRPVLHRCLGARMEAILAHQLHVPILVLDLRLLRVGDHLVFGTCATTTTTMPRKCAGGGKRMGERKRRQTGRV